MKKSGDEYYNMNKCKCIRGKRIIGVGTPEDEHLACHQCGDGLFPWERQVKICGGCWRVNAYNRAVKEIEFEKEVWEKGWFDVIWERIENAE